MSKLTKNVQQAKDEQFRKLATKTVVCQSLNCPIREHCLRSVLKDYVPEDYIIVKAINLRNPKMQSEDCPQYCPDHPVRMPLGLKQMYYDMPTHLGRAIKNRLIYLLNRKLYYEYHNGRRPVTPDVEAIIRQTLLAAGWQQDPAFDGYVEEYLI